MVPLALSLLPPNWDMDEWTSNNEILEFSGEGRDGVHSFSRSGSGAVF